MGKNTDLVYGPFMNDGVIFSNATMVAIAGLREEKPERGNGELQVLRFATGDARGALIDKDSRSTRFLKSLQEIPVTNTDIYSDIIKAADCLAKDLKIDSTNIETSSESIDLLNSIAKRQAPHGAWLNIALLLASIRNQISPNMKCFLDFIDAHLDVERSLLTQLKGNLDQAMIEKEAAEWLCCSAGKANLAYIKYPDVMRLLYWLALVDLGIRVQEHSNENTIDNDFPSSKIKKYIPKIENEKYVGGFKQWLEHYRRQVAEHAGDPMDGKRPSRKTMCKTINRLYEENQDLTYSEFANVPPLHERYGANAIDERLGRYISGEEHLGLTDIHEFLGSQGSPFTLHNLAIVLLAQLDDFKRSFESLADIETDELIAVYELYPGVSAAVDKRYKDFRKDGLLS